jgi:hypothetical protein
MPSGPSREHRAAIGARHLLFDVFGRVLSQLALDVLMEALLAADMLSATTLTASEAMYLLAAVATVRQTVGLMAAVGAARRSLRIHPSDALRARHVDACRGGEWMIGASVMLVPCR